MSAQKHLARIYNIYILPGIIALHQTIADILGSLQKATSLDMSLVINASAWDEVSLQVESQVSLLQLSDGDERM